MLGHVIESYATAGGSSNSKPLGDPVFTYQPNSAIFIVAMQILQ